MQRLIANIQQSCKAAQKKVQLTVVVGTLSTLQNISVYELETLCRQ